MSLDSGTRYFSMIPADVPLLFLKDPSLIARQVPSLIASLIAAPESSERISSSAHSSVSSKIWS